MMYWCPNCDERFTIHVLDTIRPNCPTCGDPARECQTAEGVRTEIDNGWPPEVQERFRKTMAKAREENVMAELEALAENLQEMARGHHLTHMDYGSGDVEVPARKAEVRELTALADAIETAAEKMQNEIDAAAAPAPARCKCCDTNPVYDEGFCENCYAHNVGS